MTLKDPISVSHPDLAAEAVGWDPATVTFGSVRMLEWRCPLGHIYPATPNNRSHGTTCSYCSNRKVLAGFNDLASKDPELAAQAVVGDPSKVTQWSHQVLGWRCALGHEWFERVSERSGGYGCPYCSGQRVLVGFNDLATTHPNVAAQASGWGPTKVSKGSNVHLMWQCDLGHHYEATPNKRTTGRGCPYCSGNRVLAGYNDLATKHPHLAVEAEGWDPSSVTTGSNQKLTWLCDEEHLYDSTVKNRVRGRGCPHCFAIRRSAPREAAPRPSRRVMVPAFVDVSDLRTLRPDLAGEAVDWDPHLVSVRSTLVRLWRCATCTHEWEASPGARDSGLECPYCSGKRVLPGVTDLATVHPEVAAQALGWDPSTVLATSWKKVAWVCSLGHDWVSPIGERLRGYDCPFCKGKRVWPGFNDLATTHPVIASEADGWDPSTVSRGHETKVKWRCAKCGYGWSASPNNRTNMQSGCPVCAPYGYSSALPGWLYLLENGEGLLQIGITNYPDQRLAQHARHTWVQLDLVGPFDGGLVHSWEQSILRALRAMGYQAGPPESTGSVGGFTETWYEHDFSVRSIDELLVLIEVSVQA
jgi:DNA-directed RNA polymerase subunit RPC12/RpoP